MKFGMVIYLAENEAYNGEAPRYHQIREMAQYAEANNFNSIWLYDHLLYRHLKEGTTGIWECWTTLSALTEATEQIELGTLVLCNQFRNPAILAKMAITLDEVSGGRLILGIGAGWNKPEFEAFGIPFDHKVDRFEEAIQIIKPLLETGKVDFEGTYYKAKDCEITPWGPRKPGPLLMIGALKPRMMRLTAQHADIWNTGYLGSPKTLEEPLSKLKASCERYGRDLATIQITGMVALVYPDLLHEGEDAYFKEYLTGSPEELAEAFREYQSMGVSHLMFHIKPYTKEVVDILVAGINKYRKSQTDSDNR
jgi:alkanesulfonate monooxygenase SsuD/methylene tetrahydromethanopterin reductase-like flavin-dependent oxidoreductase (luciferase family)